MKKDIDQEITRIYLRDGEVRASVVLEEAHDPDSPLHDQFTWDDGIAAHEYRLDQARKLIRVATIIIEDRDPQPLIHVALGTDSREGYYRPRDEILRSTTEFDAALGEALMRLAAARRYVEQLEGKGAPPTVQHAVTHLDSAQRILESVVH